MQKKYFYLWIFIFTPLFAISLATHESIKWKYQNYNEYTHNMNIKKTNKKYQFCSFEYEGRNYGASDCYLSNNTMYIKTCGNKDQWCSLSLTSHNIKENKQSPCNVISQNYDKISVLMYLSKLITYKKPTYNKMPDCITGV